MPKTSPEKLAYNKAYHEKHSERLSVYHKAYREREDRRAKAREYTKQWKANLSPEQKARHEAMRKDVARRRAATIRNERAACPDVNAHYSLMARLTNYPGLTLDKFHSILERQDFGCAICGVDVVSVRQKTVHIDHDHETGKVRGILCAKCNTGLGKLDDGRLFASAERYLARSRKKAA
jgi:23S rRNA G2069 N7-methylase RlmK/C1962 C5-methylase RlmI